MYYNFLCKMYFSQFWRLKVWNEVVSTIRFWWQTSSMLQMSYYSLYPQIVDSWNRKQFFLSSYKGTNTVYMMTSISWPHLTLVTHQTLHLLIPSYWVEFKHGNLGWDTKIQSITKCELPQGNLFSSSDSLFYT